MWTFSAILNHILYGLICGRNILPKSIPQIKFLNVVIVTLIQNKTDIINNQ